MDRTTNPVTRRLTAQGQAHVLAHLELTRSLARQISRRGGSTLEFEELCAEAQLGLVDAASRFDPTRGVPFGAYARMVIRHRLVQELTRWCRHGRLDVPRFADLVHEVFNEDNPNTLDPVCPWTREPWEAAADNEMMELLQKSLPRRWFNLLRLRYADDCSLMDIAAREGISSQAVSQLLFKAIDRARKVWARKQRAA